MSLDERGGTTSLSAAVVTQTSQFYLYVGSVSFARSTSGLELGTGGSTDCLVAIDCTPCNECFFKVLLLWDRFVSCDAVFEQPLLVTPKPTPLFLLKGPNSSVGAECALIRVHLPREGFVG